MATRFTFLESPLNDSFGQVVVWLLPRTLHPSLSRPLACVLPYRVDCGTTDTGMNRDEEVPRAFKRLKRAEVVHAWLGFVDDLAIVVSVILFCLVHLVEARSRYPLRSDRARDLGARRYKELRDRA